MNIEQNKKKHPIQPLEEDEHAFLEKVCFINGLSEEEVYGGCNGKPSLECKIKLLVKKLGGIIPK